MKGGGGVVPISDFITKGWQVWQSMKLNWNFLGWGEYGYFLELHNKRNKSSGEDFKFLVCAEYSDPLIVLGFHWWNETEAIKKLSRTSENFVGLAMMQCKAPYK